MGNKSGEPQYDENNELRVKRTAFEKAMNELRDLRRKFRDTHQKDKQKEDDKTAEGEDKAGPKESETKANNNEVAEETKKSLEKEIAEKRKEYR